MMFSRDSPRSTVLQIKRCIRHQLGSIKEIPQLIQLQAEGFQPGIARLEIARFSITGSSETEISKVYP